VVGGATIEIAAKIAGLTEDQIAERRAAPNWVAEALGAAAEPSVAALQSDFGIRGGSSVMPLS
jgi:hypothetical protein